MQVGSTVGRGVRHIIGVGLQALILAAIIATVALAMSAVYKPAGFIAGVDDAAAGKVVATLSLTSAARTSGDWPVRGDQVSFAVEASVRKASDLYKLWVANKCYQDGVVVDAQYEPVVDGASGPFTLDWSDGAAVCKAYAFLHPYTQTPLRGSTLTYDAGA
jgi:hypothetical protein